MWELERFTVLWRGTFPLPLFFYFFFRGIVPISKHSELGLDFIFFSFIAIFWSAQ
jgi:hypothetical protein